MSDYIYNDEKVEVDGVLDLRGKMHVQVDYGVIADTKHFEKVYEKMVYVILCKYANWTSKTSFPSVTQIAKEAFCSENSVRRAIKKLEDIELIRVVPRKKREGGQTSNLYVLLEIPEKFRKNEPPFPT